MPSRRSIAAQSDAKLDRYVAACDDVGYGRWCVETRAGEFLGYVGVMPSPPGSSARPACRDRLAAGPLGLGPRLRDGGGAGRTRRRLRALRPDRGARLHGAGQRAVAGGDGPARASARPGARLLDARRPADLARPHLGRDERRNRRRHRPARTGPSRIIWVSSSGARPDTPPVPAEDPPSRGGRFGRRRRVWLTGLIVARRARRGGLYAATRDSSPPPLDQAQVSTIASGVVKKAIENLQSAPAPSAVAYQQILPSLVEIETERASDGARAVRPRRGRDHQRQRLDPDRPARRRGRHAASGSPSSTAPRRSATIASTDPKNDIAVLQPEHGPETIVPAVLGGGGQVGDETYAVGHPLGFVGSLTSGVISGLNRSVTVKGGKKLTGLIQFDAAVNPGNSGGPLLNRNGQVIGIVTALANPSRDGYFIGIGFAVPIGTAGGAGQRPPKVKTREPMDRQPALDASLEQVLYQVKRVIVGQDALLERMVVALLARGHLLVEGVPGLAKTMAVKTLAAGDRRRVPAHPVHARPRAGRHRRHADLQPEARRVPGLARAGVRQPRARRRDQPRAGEGAERAARGDAGAAGDDRPRDAPAPRPVPRDGDAEPDRVRGHLPAARGAGRPVHAQGAGRLPDADRGVRDRRADDGRVRAGRAGDRRRAASPGCSARPTRSSSTRR